MNTFRLLACIALAGAMQPQVFADPVNLCKDANGRQTMTDRPCGDPSVERRQALQRPQVVVEQIQADDIFRARTMVRETGTAIAPTAGESVDSAQGQKRSDVLRQSW